mmetsp:Transcript_31997/g.77951  ORF Transcript_31997/g.77951 Transcript_31997/m.77951 type:complete len:84 (+) Transcript_31997:32-283(+)
MKGRVFMNTFDGPAPVTKGYIDSIIVKVKEKESKKGHRHKGRWTQAQVNEILNALGDGGDKGDHLFGGMDRSCPFMTLNAPCR